MLYVSIRHMIEDDFTKVSTFSNPRRFLHINKVGACRSYTGGFKDVNKYSYRHKEKFIKRVFIYYQ